MAIIKVSSLLMLFGFLIEGVSNIPVIKPEQSEVIIPKGGGYTFTCISELSIDWIFSKNGVKSNLDTASYREDDHQVSILSISGANSSHVGLYVCHDMNSKYSYAAIYVYVQGDENLYVGGEDIIYGYGALYLNLFIPCRPTSPDISVKLYETNGNDSQREIQVTKREKDGSSWSYNPSKGFLLSNVTRQSTYFCTFSRDHVVKIPVHYSLARFPPVLTRPVIYFNERHKWYPEGGVMKVGCEVDYQYSQTPTFIWKLNGTELKTDKNHRFYHNDPFLYQVNPFSYMIVHRVSVYGDSGEYTCEVNIGNYRKKTSQTVNIEYSTTLIFQELKNVFSKTCIGTCKSITWAIEMGRLPLPEIKWYNNRGEEIHNGGKYEVINTSRGDGGSMLTINNVTINDRGVFTIATKKADEERNQTIFLNVEDKPIVKIINRNPYLKNGEDNVECVVIGYPKPEINLLFTSCMDCEYITIKSNIIEEGSAKFISNAVLKFNNSGYVRCCAKNMHGDGLDTMAYTVKDGETVKIISSNMDGLQHDLILPDTYNFTCNYEGFPVPHITWYKDNVVINEDNRIQFNNNNQTLSFVWTTESDEGEYICNVRNRFGFDQRMASIVFTNKTPVNTIYITLAVFIVVFLISCVGLALKIISKREFNKALERAGLINLEIGAIECINPDLAIHDQVNLLPFDRESWEISKHSMKLGEQLGAGAFGVVMKGVIYQHSKGTKHVDVPLTVAVKMMNNTADDTNLKALVTELKVMAHLGHHLNIVNLIGAWTKHIVKRELYVITEYCRFGNVHDYLLRHRENFINQIDPVTKEINYEIGADILKSAYIVRGQQGQLQDMTGGQVNPNFPQITEDTLVNHEDEFLMRQEVSQSGCNSKCEDNKVDIRPICTKDLLAWIYQVSRGMEYLVSRKILHGDLAARNILLTDNNIVKISDFGLSKSLYQSDYRKKGDVPLPMKWMSLEAIRDKIFSTQSDVWSFGIVLWEFFSLAESPYPGMEAGEKLFQKLMNGYRMDCPVYATKEIHAIMLNCWEANPLNRPSFVQLGESIGNMLEENIKKYYIDLNLPYIKMNMERFENEQNDYLKMASPPDFQKLSSPHHLEETMHTRTPNTTSIKSEPNSLPEKTTAIY